MSTASQAQPAASAQRPNRILVVDDEENISFLLDSALRHFGYEVRTAATGREALRQIEQFAPDLMLLDVMLPDLDGFEIVRRMRMDGIKVPVLFLTARDAVDDKVRGLTLGGDDYVTKPFSLEEVMARIQVILRRQGVVAASSKLALSDLEMDDDAHTVRRAGELIDLSPTEYNLLRFLLLNTGRVMSRNQILDHVWQYDFGGNATVVETYISYLRKKVDRLGPPLIHTVRGVGYSLRVS
ncbi:MAG: two-component system, OmpR family, response regulator [Acidimicrobiaceae bacterium]|nr:two-component system, OmpR family, response regulator [Acidimicrobiaceae bacterium]